MRSVVHLRFVLLALGAVSAFALTFGAAVARAATPPYLVPGPESGATGTAATVAAVIVTAGVAIVAIVYAITALRRASSVPVAPALTLAPKAAEPEHTRKVA
jgi:hypothetical protein